ncbi:septal ring lytic transglycosylase RlpA family protein [Cutibacterium avidum]|mgnify:FL=1|uniref:septal ring lytic transglycosylase RlpA family protein n=1 Tax=Cutibacterium avidum TaxID=33010 RepID=UPI0007641BCD|nr:septal ring lytic transglycosylase RlpA family protein [Cutibacterium avidum]KXA67878.1 G5 domain protein [Cutibacterium avidum]MCO6632157.1 septal ring lytic transglycosylase RlpA family protein [Cutibacterium avidum]MCO6660617.1 septal ring lytic transglycosylase RlpA family protein [Cutibacterium avidum]MCT1415434.1 septal ring lytic transglycosylase RlpA family protein [Cutibacterium avidum]MCX8467337.1 septal ring lytic transglycosylase RlpA family protein [Cutibacterium avidum]
MSKVVASAIAGALSLTSAGGLTMVQALDRDTVTFSVDGVSEQGKVKPGTVKQALAQHGITVGPHDDVQPSLDSEIHDGQVITVNYGRRVVVTIDGKKVVRWTTAKNVSEVLDQLNQSDPDNLVSVSRSLDISRAGLSFSMQTAKDVTVTAGGKTQKVSAVGTVADALKAAKISVDSSDVSKPGLGTPLADGMKITLIMVDQKSQKRRVAVPFSTKRVETPSMAKGATEIATKGVKGTNEETWIVVYKDGKKVSEKKVSTKVVKAPVTQVVKVGTKKAESSSASSRSNAGSRSNSGSTSNPVTSGSTCVASTYGEGDGTAGGPTASGETFDPSALTAASRTLPLGSTIRVTNVNNGRTVTVRINDRGPYVGGRCLDLSTAAMNAIAPGQGLVTVRYS